MSEANKAFVRRLWDVWHSRDLDKLANLIAEDHVNHDPNNPADLVGVDGYRELITFYTTMFSDLRFEIHNIVAEGDIVCSRWTSVGTHDGEVLGIAPTGNSIARTGLSWQRIESGKIVETWVERDGLGLAARSGLRSRPSPCVTAPTASCKMRPSSCAPARVPAPDVPALRHHHDCRDGTRLMIAEQAEPGNFDIVGLTVGDPQKIERLLTTEYSETMGEVSPDGNWLAYQSDETGQNEVWVRSFPDANRRRIKISVSGGTMPLWGHAGRELFFRGSGGGMFAVPVELTPNFAHGEVTEVFPDRGYSGTGGGRSYDISPIDGRFLMRKTGADDSVAGDNITVVLNWHQELLERVPVP